MERDFWLIGTSVTLLEEKRLREDFLFVGANYSRVLKFICWSRQFLERRDCIGSIKS
jgi:hypothetical protein